MRRFVTLLPVLLCLTCVGWCQQLLVFPAVTDELSGANDSLWVTVVRLVKVDPAATVTVRRKWVCLPGGGFVDDPADAPAWTLHGGDWGERMLIAWGDELIGDTGSAVGAVALQVEGGEVLAHAYVADVLRGSHSAHIWSVGQGQLMAAVRQPQIGPSHVPWLGGSNGMPTLPDTTRWQYLRNNIGLVNPNPEPLVVTCTAIPFDSNPPTELTPQETFVEEVPPYGWTQLPLRATNSYGTDVWDVPYSPTAGFVLSLTPDGELPYYAYASVVFSPDPESGVPAFSDPMYVPAEPGYVPASGEEVP